MADVTAGVMMASIIYPVLGNEPAVFCPEAVGLARQAVSDGVVMTDDLWGTALRAWQRPDLQILPAEYPDPDWLALAERMAADPDLQVLVEAAVRRVLVLKQRLVLIPFS